MAAAAEAAKVLTSKEYVSCLFPEMVHHLVLIVGNGITTLDIELQMTRLIQKFPKWGQWPDATTTKTWIQPEGSSFSLDLNISQCKKTAGSWSQLHEIICKILSSPLRTFAPPWKAVLVPLENTNSSPPQNQDREKWINKNYSCSCIIFQFHHSLYLAGATDTLPEFLAEFIQPFEPSALVQDMKKLEPVPVKSWWNASSVLDWLYVPHQVISVASQRRDITRFSQPLNSRPSPTVAWTKSFPSSVLRLCGNRLSCTVEELCICCITLGLRNYLADAKEPSRSQITMYISNQEAKMVLPCEKDPLTCLRLVVKEKKNALVCEPATVGFSWYLPLSKAKSWHQSNSEGTSCSFVFIKLSDSLCKFSDTEVVTSKIFYVPPSVSLGGSGLACSCVEYAEELRLLFRSDQSLLTQPNLLIEAIEKNVNNFLRLGIESMFPHLVTNHTDGCEQVDQK